MATKKRIVYSCDFETTTDPADVRVWAACGVEVETGNVAFRCNSIEGFFDFYRNKNSVAYFHNERFDGEFILHWLLSHGFKYSEDPKPRTFSTLITDAGLFYKITIIFDKIGKQYKKLEIYDSLKKLPLSVAEIAQAFKLPISKGSIDYEAPRPRGYQPTPEEWEYIETDCKIVAAALKLQFSQGLKKMTNAADALHDFKERIGKKNFERFFPVFPLEMDSDIRRAYRGGFTYLNPKYKNKRIKGGKVYDVNSLYPDRMYNCILPYSYPYFFEGKYKDDPNFPLYICRISCEFKLKPGHIPTVQLKNSFRFNPTDYLTESDGEPVEMTMTNIDLALFLDHYDVEDLTYICGWKFRGVSGIFKEYIDYWKEIKENNEGGIRFLAKRQQNSLYGKFASSPIKRKKIPYLDEEGVVRYTLSDPEEDEPIYTAMAVFITAYAREKTIRAAQLNYDRFIYADTDSLHLEGTEPAAGIEIHPKHIGAWKDEGTFVDSVYIRAKTYLETMQHVKDPTLKNYASALNSTFNVWRFEDHVVYHELKVTCAGMPDNVKAAVNYENFKPGSVFDGKLMPRRYPGGIVLEPTTFTIK